MIIISSRKFRDTQNNILKKAMSEEVILTTLHYGNFRLVPIHEGEDSYHRPNVEVPTENRVENTTAYDHAQATVSQEQKESLESKTGAEKKTNSKEVERKEINKEIVNTTSTETSPVNKVNNKENINTSWAEKTREIEEFDKAFTRSQEKQESSNKSDYSVRTSENNGSTIIIEERIEPETNRVFEPFTPPVIKKKPTRVIVDGSIEDWELEEQNRGPEVFVDPSLLSLEEALKQQGLEPDKPKKGFFSRLFGKKS